MDRPTGICIQLGKNWHALDFSLSGAIGESLIDTEVKLEVDRDQQSANEIKSVKTDVARALALHSSYKANDEDSYNALLSFLKEMGDQARIHWEKLRNSIKNSDFRNACRSSRKLRKAFVCQATIHPLALDLKLLLTVLKQYEEMDSLLEARADEARQYVLNIDARMNMLRAFARVVSIELKCIQKTDEEVCSLDGEKFVNAIASQLAAQEKEESEQLRILREEVKAAELAL